MGNNLFCCSERSDGYDALSILSSRPPTKSLDDNFDTLFTLEEQLGRGSTALCYACVENSTGTRFAVKIIDKRKMSLLYSELLPQFRREVEILERLQHDNIIRLERVFETADRIHVVTELATGGELFEFLVSRPNSNLTEATVAFLMRQCFAAVAHMHRFDIIHRDIKLENILLARPPVEKADGEIDLESIQLKIIDFGLAKSFNGTELRTTKTFFGTVGYMAPEMIRRRAYTQAVDMWALGVVTFVLLCGVFPFDDSKNRVNASIDYRLRYPKWVGDLSLSAKDLLSKVLHVDPKKRLSAEDALRHPWLSGQTASPRNVLNSPGHLRELRSPPVVPSMIGGSESRDAGMLLDSLRTEEQISPFSLDSTSPKNQRLARDAGLGAALDSVDVMRPLRDEKEDAEKDDDDDGSSDGTSSSSSLGSPSLQ